MTTNHNLLFVSMLQEGSDFTFLVGEKEEPIYVHIAILKMRQVGLSILHRCFSAYVLPVILNDINTKDVLNSTEVKHHMSTM